MVKKRSKDRGDVQINSDVASVKMLLGFAAFHQDGLWYAICYPNTTMKLQLH